MLDRYEDMAQVVGDFYDWYTIRRWIFYVKNIEINKDMELFHKYLLHKEVVKLFGHNNSMSDDKQE